MDLLKTPHQLLMEEQGADVDGAGLLLTPKQMLMEESGILPHFAQGKKVEDMRAELFVRDTAPKQQALHPKLTNLWNNIFK
jgi:hypothetical protein